MQRFFILVLRAERKPSSLQLLAENFDIGRGHFAG